MTNQIDNIPLIDAYRIPSISLIITTYELSENVLGENPSEWLATVTHVFQGDTVERAYQISDAHRKTDLFYDGSFKGKYNGIILKNSEFQIIKS